jgi:hypothetical protein
MKETLLGVLGFILQPHLQLLMEQEVIPVSGVKPKIPAPFGKGVVQFSMIVVSGVKTYGMAISDCGHLTVCWSLLLISLLAL